MRVTSQAVQHTHQAVLIGHLEQLAGLEVGLRAMFPTLPPCAHAIGLSGAAAHASLSVLFPGT